MDKQLIKFIVDGHAKVASEFIYMETGAIPLRFVAVSRRLNYLTNIFDRNENELVKRIYYAQNGNPSPGDWVNLIVKDFETIGEKYNENEIKEMSKQ